MQFLTPKKLNLLDSFPSIIRDYKSRTINKEVNRIEALKFGKKYFDGDRNQGYGGYKYDGRWIKIANKLIKIFDLNQDSKFLDIGCAKGFLLFDLFNINPEINLYGIDISEYSKINSPEPIRNKIEIGNCKKLNFQNNFFDGVVSINTVHNLNIDDCKNAIYEIQRVSNGRAFIQVDAYRNESELSVFKDWMLTAQTYLRPEEWMSLFKEVGYTGYYYWTILELSGETN